MALIVLTNDDGFDATSFQVLYNGLKNDYDVFVSAPRYEQSGSSHSLTLRRPIKVEKLRDRFFVIDGTPTDCILLAYHDLIKEPIGLVVSGINNGPNMGSDVFYSGTVAAALQASHFGIKSMAVSMADPAIKNFSHAVEYVKSLIDRVLQSKTENMILNVNIPEGKIKGERITKMGKRIYNDKVYRNNEKDNVMYSVIDGVLSCKLDADTDFQAVNEGYVSITPLKLDLTDDENIEELKKLLPS
jgi:5'-nucleotidase